MKVRRGLIHVQHHVEHIEMGVPLLKGLCELCQRLRCPLAALRTVAAVVQVADLEDGLMEQLLLLALPDMLVVVQDLIPCLFLPGVVCLQRLAEQLVIGLLQILVDENNILPRPLTVYIGGGELPVVMPDAAMPHHAGNCCTDTSHPSFPLRCFFVFYPVPILPYSYR